MVWNRGCLRGFFRSDEVLRKEKAKLGFERVNGFNHEAYGEKLLRVINGN